MRGFLIIVLIAVLNTSLGWKNAWDQSFTFKCAKGMAISHMRSHHDNGKEDRLFDFTCSRVKGYPSICQWSGYINNFDEPVAYVCPYGGVVSGFESYHDNGKEDRRWKVYCCHSRKHTAQKCEVSRWLSKYDEDVNYVVPHNRVFHGFFSIHDNSKEDRIWNLLTCSFEKSCN